MFAGHRRAYNPSKEAGTQTSGRHRWSSCPTCSTGFIIVKWWQTNTFYGHYVHRMTRCSHHLSNMSKRWCLMLALDMEDLYIRLVRTTVGSVLPERWCKSKRLQVSRNEVVKPLYYFRQILNFLPKIVFLHHYE